MSIGQMRQAIFKDDSNLSLFQQSLNDQFSQIGKIPFINGIQINDTDLVSGQANVINHKLGKKATGYFIISNLANATVWNDRFTDDMSITLRCSTGTTVSLWVF